MYMFESRGPNHTIIARTLDIAVLDGMCKSAREDRVRSSLLNSAGSSFSLQDMFNFAGFSDTRSKPDCMSLTFACALMNIAAVLRRSLFNAVRFTPSPKDTFVFPTTARTVIAIVWEHARE